jgi:hypothetical protein
MPAVAIIIPLKRHRERTNISGSSRSGAQAKLKRISTSLVERQNLAIRMGMRQFMRLTNVFSKKTENQRAAGGLYFAHYNFARQHKGLGVTPAIAVGVSVKMGSFEELVEQTSK